MDTNFGYLKRMLRIARKIVNNDPALVHVYLVRFSTAVGGGVGLRWVPLQVEGMHYPPWNERLLWGDGRLAAACTVLPTRTYKRVNRSEVPTLNWMGGL